MRNKKSFAVLPATLLLALSLSACGGSDAGSGQSVADACAVLNEEGQATLAQFQNVNPTDPDALTGVIDAAKQVGANVTNPEVKSAWDSVTAGLDDAGSLLADVDLNNVDESNIEELTKKAEQLQTTMADAGRKLQELCPGFGGGAQS